MGTGAGYIFRIYVEELQVFDIEYIRMSHPSEMTDGVPSDLEHLPAALPRLCTAVRTATCGPVSLSAPEAATIIIPAVTVSVDLQGTGPSGPSLFTFYSAPTNLP